MKRFIIMLLILASTSLFFTQPFLSSAAEQNEQQALAVHPENIKLTNYQLELIVSGPAINKVTGSISDINVRLSVYNTLMMVQNSDKYKSYIKVKNEIIKKFQDEQKAKPEAERKVANFDNMPDLFDLMNADSGIEIQKINISNKLLKDITVNDMKETSWLINFVE